MPRRDELRAAVAHGREAVVSLSQTEIMLVLATVILLLLLAKETDLRNTQSALAAAKGDAQVLAERVDRSPEEIAEQRRQADLAREVKEVLSRNGEGRRPEDRPRLAPRDVEAVRQALAERDQQRAEQAAVDEALTRANVVDSMATRERQIERLGEAAAAGAALREILPPDQAAALADAQAAPQPRTALRELLADWAGDRRAKGAGTGDEVGFTPCWPRTGQRRYFFAYDITYADGTYQVLPHRDWVSGEPVVMDALAGPLGQVLRDHPKTPVSEVAMREFGQRVQVALDGLREEGTYRQDCLLAVTINGEASNNVSKFLRVQARFYPVTL